MLLIKLATREIPAPKGWRPDIWAFAKLYAGVGIVGTLMAGGLYFFG